MDALIYRVKTKHLCTQDELVNPLLYNFIDTKIQMLARVIYNRMA